jgi:tetratricopeptide (TPR) repeat protein
MIAWVLFLIVLLPAADVETVRKQVTEGYSLSREGRYREAERVFQSAVSEAAKTGRDSSHYATALNGLGMAWYRLGRYAEAAAAFEEVAALQERSGESISLPLTLSNLGSAYRNLGRFEDAERALSRGLSILGELRRPGDHVALPLLHNLTLLLLDTGKLQAALEAATNAERAARLGGDELELATVLTSRASVLKESGKYFDAERALRRARAIRERRLGREHPETAKTINNLGDAVQFQRRFKEAEKLYTEAHRIMAIRVGEDHVETWYVLNNLATVRLEQRHPEGLAPTLERALTVMEKAHGRRHRGYLSVAQNLAVCYLLMGRFEEAETGFRTALALIEDAAGTASPQYLLALGNIAESYRRAKRLREAEGYFQRALAVSEAGLADHPYVAVVLSNYSLLLKTLGRKKEAKVMSARAADIAGRHAQTSFAGSRVHIDDLK